MCDGYDCQNVGSVQLNGEWYCKEHATAVMNGIDPMDVEDGY